MKIVLIQACSLISIDSQQPFYKKSKRYSYAATTLTTLASVIPESLNAEIRIYDEGVEEVPGDLEADIVGISAMTPNAPRAYQLADGLRAKGIKVVLGGYHPTACPEEALAHADAVVVGFAEETWPRLLLDFRAGSMKKIYRDFSFKTFQSNLPHARRDLLKQGAYSQRGTIETTRGCYNRCEYCVIPNSTGGRLYHRPISQVIEEIRTLKNPIVTFLDSSPTEDMDYAKALYKALIPEKRRWLSAATLKAVYDDEWLDLAQKSGCKGVLIGFETVNQNTLNNCRKRFNKADEYKTLIKKLHDRDIAVLGCFVLGLDGDDKHIFHDTLQFVNEAHVDLCQYMVFTPLPGSPIFHKMHVQNRIIEHDWSLYDGKHVVIEPTDMTPEQLHNGIRWLWKNTYTISSIFQRLLGSKTSFLVMAAANYMFRRYGTHFIPKEFDTLQYDSDFLDLGRPRQVAMAKS